MGPTPDFRLRAPALVIFALLIVGWTVGASGADVDQCGGATGVATTEDALPALRSVDLELETAARLANPPGGDYARARSLPPATAHVSGVGARVAGREALVRSHALYDLNCTYRL